jgi:hypothetical protein
MPGDKQEITMLTRSAPGEVRRHAAGTIRVSPPRQSGSTALGDLLPAIDGDGKVVRLRASSRKKPGSPRWDGTGKSEVIDLRWRRPASRRDSGLSEWRLGEWNATSKSLAEEIEKHQYALETDDDSRHRIAVNFLAAGVLVLLTIIGEWAVSTLAQVT